MEMRAPHMPGEQDDAPSKLSFRDGRRLPGDRAAGWRRSRPSGSSPASSRPTKAIGIPTAFAALVIIPLLGNVAENYVALRYAWAGDGDARDERDHALGRADRDC